MEPITHFLTGACMGRAGLNRKTALATLTLTLGAEAPDLDVLAAFRGRAFGFAHHRGFTHSFLGVPLTAVLVVAVVYLIWRFWRSFLIPLEFLVGAIGLARLAEAARRLRGRNTINPDLPPRWGLLYFYACLAGLSHILLDFTNNYGVRPFWPFSEKWYSWDIVFIVEPVMLALLILGLTVPLLFGLIDSEIGAPRRRAPRGRLGASLALLGIVALWGLRDYEHRRAVNALEARTYQGADPVRISAYPAMTTPFRWYGVVETPAFFALPQVITLDPEVEPDNELEIRYKPEETPVTLAAKKSYMGRVYLDWAQYPITEVEELPPPQGGYIVHFIDLRYAQIPPVVSRGRGRRGALSVAVQLDKNLHVVGDVWGSDKDQVVVPEPGQR